MALWGWLLLAYLPVAALQPVWAHLVVRSLDRNEVRRSEALQDPGFGSARNAHPGRLSDRRGLTPGTISHRRPGANCPPS